MRASNRKIAVPPFGIRITHSGRVYRSKWSEPLGEDPDCGEVHMVIYTALDDGVTWVPFSIITAEGEYDCEYSKRSGNLYYEMSGWGSTLYLGTCCKPRTLPYRVWIKDGAQVRLGQDSVAVVPTDKQLRALGYQRVANIPSPFAHAINERAHWIGSDLPDDKTHACCGCEEREDRENMDALLLVFDEDAAGLDEAGIYKITRFPFYMDGMVTGYIIESSIERLCDMPKGLSEPNGYPCGFLCVKCSRKYASRKRAKRTAPITTEARP